MKYKILIGKNEIIIDEEEKDFFVNNQDKKFIVLKSGEAVNVAFVQGIIIDRDATIQEKKEIKMIENTREIENYEEVTDPKHIKELFKKYRPNFDETK